MLDHEYCPFCGNNRHELIRYRFGRIACLACGAKGPKKKNAKEAGDAWRQRVRRMDAEE